MSQICIVGGGFGGLYTALHLTRLPWNQKPSIVLIDKSDRFLFTPLLYELITAELEPWEIAPSFVELLKNTGVRFIHATATAIDTENRRISLSGEVAPAEISYDRLLLALGGETPINIVPGATEYALPFRTLKDAQRLNERLTQLEASSKDKIRVCIAGGGSSGVELACKISDRLGDRGRVRLVDRNSTILTDSTTANRAAAEKALLARNVWIDLSTSVVQINDGEVVLDYGGGNDILPVDIVMWTVGNRMSKLVESLPLPHSPRGGRVITEPTLQVQYHPELFAIGDLALCRDADGQLLPANAQVAYQQSQYCATNIWASLNQRHLTPFKYLELGEFLSLGIEDAAMSVFNQFTVEGVPAIMARRLIYLMRMPTLEHQMKVGLNWLTKPMVNAIEKVTGAIN
ncbi:FAD-dependent pyridine nucleotide-disulfide oxidoreductase [Thalassoporum mexicanum PCC 7367]|uniref:NAD(P)/FAD-dependent oxidoreductase n=1 Tax=Thalassoporum mexicanum TaxID=3457544 RepID=UPI00029FB947|nr:NAD(P)/FAD-dependent oxidoreductase [Pseudanabaena sp. PCC 7367]AFY70278.1 FAD-dependent pyridine nucleotide-disulfide oxidoreductase [Pseudanabaena sp. PCC 7367]